MWKRLSVHCFQKSERKVLCLNVIRFRPFPDRDIIDMKNSVEH
jgi:hypothetical protein